MIRPLRIAALACCFALLISPAASAAQMDAREKPSVKGPLTTSDELKNCKSKRQRSDGELVARFKVCTSYYIFDPAQETNANRDYGAYWIQVNINSTNGWCSRVVKTNLSLPNGVHQKAPKPGTSVKRGRVRSYTTKLRVDAQGAAVDDGVIKNSVRLWPGRLRAVTRNDGNTYRLRWAGNSAAKLAFAAGLELSWVAGESPPTVNSAVRALFREGGC
jgi:hypothetical protein